MFIRVSRFPPPPDIGIRMIRHDAQNTVLPRVFEPFPGFPPPRTRIARENFLKSMVFLYVYKGFRSSLGIFTVRLLGGGGNPGGGPLPPGSGSGLYIYVNFLEAES